MDSLVSTTTGLPFEAPLRIQPGGDLEFEMPLGPDVSAIVCSGTIEVDGEGSSKDLVLSFRFENDQGEVLDDASDGLLQSNVVGDFFYPLRSGTNGKFSERAYLTQQAARLVLTVVIWRPGSDASYTLSSLELRLERHEDVRFLSPPDFGPGDSSLAWVLERLEASAPGPKAILDVAEDGDYADLTTSKLVGNERKVECVRLLSDTIADSRFAVKGARLLPGTVNNLPSERKFDLVVVANQSLDWSNVIDEMGRWEELLRDDGLLVVAMPSELSSEPPSWRQSLKKRHGSKAPARFAGRINNVLRFAASYSLRPLSFRAIGSVPISPETAGLEDKSWILLRKSEGVELCREQPLVSEALAAQDWCRAADLLVPDMPDLSSQHSTPYLRSLADAFAAAAKEANRAGETAAALNCLRVAATLKPESEQSLCELVAYLRVAERFGEANHILEIGRARFPDSWTIRLHEALVASAAGLGLEATRILEEYIEAMPIMNASKRRAITFVLRNFARECQSGGLRTEAVHPLLLPEVMEAYSENLDGNAAKWHESPTSTRFKEDSAARAEVRASARQRSAGVVHDRPVRMLIVTSGSWKFLTSVFTNLEAGPEIDARTYDMGFLDEEYTTVEHLHEVFAPVSLGLDPDEVWQRAIDNDATLEELVDWCDVVFCEWSSRHAIWLSRFLPPDKRLIVRLHSYEAFTPWPFFINYGGIDGMIFVAEHIRRFAELQFRMGDLGVSTEVLPNFNDLLDHAQPKTADAPRTLAMLGYSNLNKDPLVAVEILAKLREDDPRWQLHLFGDYWDEPTLGEYEAAYFREFQRTVGELDLDSAIHYRGYTRDVPSDLRDVGFILSCSRREGTHEAIIEGMATGAIPVIRRWPMVRCLGAPETTYPDLNYFDTVDEAIRQIRELSSAGSFERHSAEAIDYARTRFDQRAVYPRFVDFVRQMTGKASR